VKEGRKEGRDIRKEHKEGSQGRNARKERTEREREGTKEKNIRMEDKNGT
jgi:hypothetical protein